MQSLNRESAVLWILVCGPIVVGLFLAGHSFSLIHGATAVPGLITRMHGRSKYQVADVSYRSESGEALTFSQQVTFINGMGVDEGQKVTVLYNPKTGNAEIKSFVESYGISIWLIGAGLCILYKWRMFERDGSS